GCAMLRHEDSLPGAPRGARAPAAHRIAGCTGTAPVGLAAMRYRRAMCAMIESRDDTRPGDDADSLRRDLVGKLYFVLAKFPAVATRNDQFLALAFAIRDRVLHRWVASSRTYLEGKHRSVIY